MIAAYRLHTSFSTHHLHFSATGAISATKPQSREHVSVAISRDLLQSASFCISHWRRNRQKTRPSWEATSSLVACRLCGPTADRGGGQVACLASNYFFPPRPRKTLTPARHASAQTQAATDPSMLEMDRHSTSSIFNFQEYEKLE